MDTVVVTLKQSDLASRPEAAGLREEVERRVLEGTVVLLNLSSVECISQSYADELFGVLAERNGLDWVLSNVKVKSSRDVLTEIALAIKTRLRSGPPSLFARELTKGRSVTTRPVTA